MAASAERHFDLWEPLSPGSLIRQIMSRTKGNGSRGRYIRLLEQGLADLCGHRRSRNLSLLG